MDIQTIDELQWFIIMVTNNGHLQRHDEKRIGLLGDSSRFPFCVAPDACFI